MWQLRHSIQKPTERHQTLPSQCVIVKVIDTGVGLQGYMYIQTSHILLLQYTHTRQYLVWVNLVNEDVLWFEVPVDDSLAVQEANPLVCGEKSTYHTSKPRRSQYTTQEREEGREKST